MKTDIDKIKDLLFGNEKKALDAITRRLETPESRTADVADVLPESILRSHTNGQRLVPALQEPVEQCIKNSIRRDPEDFADILFPVIGPAIRKSIAEALRSMVQSINEGIENSLSFNTRFAAWRAGVPLGQYILQHSILYRVEQAYLIKRDDGLLIEHVQRDDIVAKDTDAVSAMFTAIQEFIQDSFSQDRGESLTTAVMGDLTLWAVHGPHASLVCVIRGVAPSDLRTELRERLERIHLRYDDALSDYDGDARIAGVDTELQKCLLLEQRKESAAGEAGRNKLPLPVLLVFAGLLLLAAWFWFSRWDDVRRLEAFRDALDATPGIVINTIDRDHGLIVVRGLRDPLSTSPADIAPGFLIDPTELSLDLAPYQSLDTAIVERRARRILLPPPGVGLNLEGNRLRLSGSAPIAWKERAQTLAVAIPGVESVDTSRMALSDAEILTAAYAELQPPATAVLAVRNGTITGTGMAPQSWLLDAARRLPAIPGVQSGDLGGIAVQERLRLRQLLSSADVTEVFFSEGDILLAGQDAVLERLSREIREIVSLAVQVSGVPQIRITGSADGLGGAQGNRVVEQARADRVASWLVDAGVASEFIETRLASATVAGTDIDPALRKAVITIGVVEAEAEAEAR